MQCIFAPSCPPAHPTTTASTTTTTTTTTTPTTPTTPTTTTPTTPTTTPTTPTTTTTTSINSTRGFRASAFRAGSARYARLRFARVPRVLFCAGSARVVAFNFLQKVNTVGRHRLGPEHVQISTPETWPHPNTMRASGARALGGMFGNARATHTAKLCPKNTGAKTQKCWDKKSCAGSAGAKKVYAGHARSHIGTLLPRDVSLHDCRHIEIDA